MTDEDTLKVRTGSIETIRRGSADVGVCKAVSEMHGSRLLCSRLFDFFFQAEDGIRDIGVTGVQTCALPISVEDLGPAAEGGKRDEQLGGGLGQPEPASIGLERDEVAPRQVLEQVGAPLEIGRASWRERV